MINKLKHPLAAAFLWNAVDQISRLGITRLVFFPLALYYIGSESFADLIIAVSIYASVGNAVQNAFSDNYIKTLQPGRSDVENNQLSSHAANALLVTILIVLVTLTMTSVFANQIGGDDILLWIAVLSLHYVILVPTEILMVNFRVNRQFKPMALIHASGSVSLVALVLLFPFIGKTAVLIAILAWAITPMILMWKFYRPLKLKPSAALALANAKSISFLFFSSVTMLSAGYADRFFLAIWWPGEPVTIFFAAVSLSMLFQAPALVISTFVLSMLAKIAADDQRIRKLTTQYFFATCAYSVCVYFASLYISTFLLQFLYPNQSVEAATIMPYCAGTTALYSAVSLFRPFIVRYRPSQWVFYISIITLVAKLAFIILLVESGGYVGAAKALLYGALVSALFFLLAFTTFLKGKA